MEARKITVIKNSVRTIESSAEIWGELKDELVNSYDYASGIKGFNPDTGETYENHTDVLPNTDFTVSLIVISSKYGN